MKKDILFIIPSLNLGGGEKSLINLLNEFNYSKYNVDLFLLEKDGAFMTFLPNEVNIVDLNNELVVFKKGLLISVLQFIKSLKFNLVYSRIMFTVENKKTTNINRNEQYAWKYFKNAVYINKEYDVAIGYLEKTSNYICMDCVKAKKKIAWYHTDINKLNLDLKFENKYLGKFTYIVTVSESCSKALKNTFPQYSNKIRVIRNISSIKMIEKLSKEDIELVKSKYKIVSVGRLSYEKGFDIAVNAMELLINKYKIDAIWYIIGEGRERHNLEGMISNLGLKDKVMLEGTQINPYKYVRQADIYVQPSRYEGMSIAIDEALILSKPIVVTNYSTVHDQINENINGLVCDMNEESVARTIVKLLNNCELTKKLIDNNRNTKFDFNTDISKLYKLID